MPSEYKDTEATPVPNPDVQSRETPHDLMGPLKASLEPCCCGHARASHKGRKGSGYCCACECERFEPGGRRR